MYCSLYIKAKQWKYEFLRNTPFVNIVSINAWKLILLMLFNIWHCLTVWLVMRFMCHGICITVEESSVIQNEAKHQTHKDVDCMVGGSEGAKTWSDYESPRTGLGNPVLQYIYISLTGNVGVHLRVPFLLIQRSWAVCLSSNCTVGCSGVYLRTTTE